MSRLAPAVSLQGSSDRAWMWVCRGLGTLVGLGTGAWWLQQWQQGHPLALWLLMVPLAAGCCAVSAWRLPHRPPWLLRWDGQCWHWQTLPSSEASAACQVQVTIDLQRWLLLRILASGSHGEVHWLALSSNADPAHWHALRSALYCARPGDPLSPSETSSATESAP